MNTKNYEQMQMTRDELGETVFYLIPNIIVHVEFFEEKAIGINLPDTMEMKVVQTEPTLTESHRQRGGKAGYPGDRPGNSGAAVCE